MSEEQNNQQEQNNNQEQEQQITQSPITSEDPVVTQSDLKRFYEAIKPYLNTVSIPGLDINENEEPVNAVITLLNNGNEVAQEPALNFKDFDISDDSENERTDIKPHRLSNAELQELSSDLPLAVNRMNNYSTEEQVVGIWIDGKPLYMKTWTNLNVNTSGSDWVVLSGVSIPNLDKVIDCKLYTQGGGGEIIIMSVGEVNGSSLAGVSVTVTSSAFNRTIKIATLQYTKTTD